MRLISADAYDNLEFKTVNGEQVLKGSLSNHVASVDPGYGVPDWITPKPKKGRGAHNVRDKAIHSLRSGLGTHIMRQPFTKELMRHTVIEARKIGASVRDISVVFHKENLPASTRTIHNILSPCRDVREEPAFRSKIVREKNSGWAKRVLSGVPRLMKGRVETKVKLWKRARLVSAWIRYHFISGFDNLAECIRAIDAGEKPP